MHLCTSLCLESDPFSGRTFLEVGMSYISSEFVLRKKNILGLWFLLRLPEGKLAIGYCRRFRAVKELDHGNPYKVAVSEFLVASSSATLVRFFRDQVCWLCACS